jgi:hypothetical protein
VTTYFSNYGAAPEDCVVSLTNAGWRVEVTDAGLRWCNPDPDDPAGCRELRRITPRLVVELFTWFPWPMLVDPSLPVPVSDWPTEAAEVAPVSVSPCLAADRVESSVEGHGHRGTDGPVLAVVRAEFEVDDGVITRLTTNVSDMTVRRVVVATFAAGDEVSCEQQATVPGADVGSVVALGPDRLSLKVDTDIGVSPPNPASVGVEEAEVLEHLGCDGSEERTCDLAAVVPEFPRIRGALTVVTKADGTITIEATTVRLASFGVRVLEDDTVIASAVLTDASCYELDGLAGVANAFELARRPRHVAPAPPPALIDQPCDPIALPPVGGADGVDTAWDLHAAFVLGARYAETR